MDIPGPKQKTFKLANQQADRWTIDFLQILDCLGSAELFLVSTLYRSIQSLRDDITLLQAAAREGVIVSNEISVLRAELAYTQTILNDFLDEIIQQPQPFANRCVGQEGQIEERGILCIINKNPQDHWERRHRINLKRLDQEDIKPL